MRLCSFIMMGIFAFSIGCKVTKIKKRDRSVPSIDVPQNSLSDKKSGALEASIVIDGELNDSVWKNSLLTRNFVDPGTGDELNGDFGGSAKIIYDKKSLYIAFEVRDSNPSSPFNSSMIDPHVWSKASGVEIMIQPGNPANNKHYFEIQVDVNRAVWDTHFSDYNSPISGRGKTRRYGHQAWKSNIKSGVKKTKTGYIIELALDWDVLKKYEPKEGSMEIPPKKDDVWRLNLYIFRNGQRDSVAWSPILGKGNFHRSSRFGIITFK
jgi:Carbohydrate family 9 binding domain-like